MTPEERQMLANLFERINATSATPRDAQAETFINGAVRAVPFAPYVLAQTVLIQQQALEAAAHRVSELEAAARQGPAPQEQGSFLGNLGKSLFGAGAASAPPRPTYDPSGYPRGPAPAPGPAYAPPPPPPPQPQAYAPPPAAGPWGAPAGGGFLHNAMSTAAGVAGGVAIGSLLGGLLGGHQSSAVGGGLSGSGFPGGGLAGGGGSETINNFYEGAPDGRDAGQFDPGQSAQNASYDDASYTDDGSFSDDSSYDNGGGGGYDDV